MNGMDEDVIIHSVSLLPVRIAEPAAEIRRDDRPQTIKVRISPYETTLPHGEPQHEQHPTHVPETTVITTATSTSATAYAIVVLELPKDSESNKIAGELKRIVFFR